MKGLKSKHLILFVLFLTLYVDIQNILCSFLNWACFNLAVVSISGEKSDAGSKLLDHSNKVWRPIVKGKKVWGAEKS